MATISTPSIGKFDIIDDDDSSIAYAGSWRANSTNTLNNGGSSQQCASTTNGTACSLRFSFTGRRAILLGNPLGGRFYCHLEDRPDYRAYPGFGAYQSYDGSTRGDTSNIGISLCSVTLQYSGNYTFVFGQTLSDSAVQGVSFDAYEVVDGSAIPSAIWDNWTSDYAPTTAPADFVDPNPLPLVNSVTSSSARLTGSTISISVGNLPSAAGRNELGGQGVAMLALMLVGCAWVWRRS